jgi:hypothetical protein
MIDIASVVVSGPAARVALAWRLRYHDLVARLCMGMGTG